MKFLYIIILTCLFSACQKKETQNTFPPLPSEYILVNKGETQMVSGVEIVTPALYCKEGDTNHIYIYSLDGQAMIPLPK